MQHTYLFSGLVPDFQQNALVPVSSKLNMPLRATTPPILRRGSKSRRRKDSGNTTEDMITSDITTSTEVRHLIP